MQGCERGRGFSCGSLSGVKACVLGSSLPQEGIMATGSVVIIAQMTSNLPAGLVEERESGLPFMDARGCFI